MRQAQFWRLCPADLEEYVVVYERRKKRERERDAWMVHYILAGWLGDKAPSIGRLTGVVTDGFKD